MSSGRIISGRYRLEKRLGRGSFGVVWQAEELLGGEAVATVAVKVFTAEVDRREIFLLAGVSHPSVLAYRAVVEDDGEVCLVTELADGGDAAARLREWPDGLPISDVREIVRSVGAALAHLHESGWIHRDVKPANILFVQGRPKLGDVGTARALTGTARATSTASLAYAAPEVFSGKFGPAVDVYALACTVYELLTGRLPFDGSMTELVHKHLTGEIAFPADMPAPFVEMIRACTAKDPDQRWSIERILRWMENEDSRATDPKPPSAAPPTPTPAPRADAAIKSAPATPPTPAAQRTAPPPRRPTPAQTPASQADAARTPKPTPLDASLRRHLRQHGDRWGESEVWRSFMQSAAPTARQHGLSERDLIRRAGHLRPEVAAAQLSERDTLARLGAWVATLRGRRWSALDWADFLDEINARDEDALAGLRDSLIARLYPAAPGATRLLDLGAGVQHLLVYAPQEKLHRPAAALLDALGMQEETVAGIWYSAKPLTVKEWSAINGQPPPLGVQPNAMALASAEGAASTLAAFQRRFPMEELRWPTMFEYDGVKWQREQASQQGAKAAQQNNPLLAIQQPRRAAARRPKTFGGLVAQTVGKAVIDALKDTQEAWLSDAEWAATMHKKLAMNLVGPVPRMT